MAADGCATRGFNGNAGCGATAGAGVTCVDSGGSGELVSFLF